VVIPLPGIGEGGLSVQAKEQLLLVKAKVKDELTAYATRPDDQWEIVLQDKVIPESAKATYKTGVLLVDLELADPGHPVDDIEMEE
jgi:HSP20 family molecular chaperone IbpA